MLAISFLPIDLPICDKPFRVADAKLSYLQANARLQDGDEQAGVSTPLLAVTMDGIHECDDDDGDENREDKRCVMATGAATKTPVGGDNVGHEGVLSVDLGRYFEVCCPS